MRNEKAENTAEKLDETVAKSEKDDIIILDIERTAVNGVHIIGALDLEKYKSEVE